MKDQRLQASNEKEEIWKDWVQTIERSEAEKIAKAIAKLPFGDAFEVIGESEKLSHIKNKQNTICVMVKLKQSDKFVQHRGNGTLAISNTEHTLPETKIKKRAELTSKMEALTAQIDSESVRYEKAGKYLANIDREERRAKATLVAASLNSMENGQEMMSALLSNMPEV